jgi:hypothetical protein
MSNSIFRLASKLAAAYKEIPYVVLKRFLLEKTAQFPGDRVIQHMGAIIEKRAADQPFGAVSVKELDSLIGELSSFGDTTNTRNLFSSYLSKLTADETTRTRAGEVFTDDVREIKSSPKRTVDEPTPVVGVDPKEIFSEYNISRKYDAQTIAKGADIVSRAVQVAFGVAPNSIKFSKDIDNGVSYLVKLTPKAGKMEIEVPIEKTALGFHKPTSFLCKLAENISEFPLNDDGVEKAIGAISQHSSFTFDPSWLKMSFTELRSEMLKYAMKKDYKQAEEAIRLIGEKYPTMMKAVLDDFQHVLVAFQKANNDHICRKCAFYQPAGMKSASVDNYCARLRMPTKQIIKASSPDSCEALGTSIKRTIPGFEGTINTSNIKIT